MLTSFASHKAGSGIAADKGKELDAEDYLDKPVSPENLLNTVAKYLK
jgi:CheY-like chemotaxis protein